jgi:hypothetical protein
MTELLPVNMSAEGLNSAAGMDPDSAPNDEDLPADGSKLSMLQQESYQMKASFAASLGFPIATASTDDKLRVMLYGVTRYSDVIKGGHTYRYGVAIRALLEIYSLQLDADLTLPVIAAKAQLGAVSASAQLMISGFIGNLAERLPNWSSFDVNSYADYVKAITALQIKVLEEPANIRPVLLSSTLVTALKKEDDDTSTQLHQRTESHALRLRLPWTKESPLS